MARDPERNRQRVREWYYANRERALETARLYREANREKLREQRRQSYWKDPEKEREKCRAWHEANPEWSAAYYAANREREIEKARTWQAAHPERVRELKREASRRKKQADPAGESERFRQFKLAAKHGMRPEDWQAMWDAQEGRCYLCGDPLSERVHVDHDHRCCPRQMSCQYCRRGLAHPECNQLIGMAGDDPGRLRQIAENLEIALKAADARLAAKPEQATVTASG